MRKLKVSIISLVGILVSIYFISCSKDNFTEQDAMNLQYQLNRKASLVQDSIAASKIKVSYSVNLVDATLSSLKSAKSVTAISGAIIEVTQNGKVNKRKVDSTGIAVFDTLKMGSATVNVVLTNYSTVNYVVDFTKSNYGSISSNSSLSGGIQLANIIPMIPLSGVTTATISGQITCELDLTNRVPEPAPAGTKVLAMVDIANSPAVPSLTGLITNISYDNLSLTTTTDATGIYTLNVPATLNGLRYNVTVANFTANQSLLMSTFYGKDTTGTLVIPATFGTGAPAASTIQTVSPVYVTISAPDYSYTPATATAMLGNSKGIDNIQLTNTGGFYTSSATFNIPIDTPYFAGTATSSPGTASLTVNSYGQVSAISVTSGSNYLSAVDNSTISFPYFLQEATFTVDTGNNNGAIINTTMVLKGKYFINDPTQITIINVSGNGSGAVLTPNFVYDGVNKDYYVNSMTITKGGSGYAKTQKFIVRVSASLNNTASGIIHLQSGAVSAIQLGSQGSNYISGKVSVVIGVPGNGGTAATVNASVNNGKITGFTGLVGGSGYTQAPSVTIISTVDKIQAKASATVSSKGLVTALSLDNAGSGYLNVPTINITPAVKGIGAGATAVVVLNTNTTVASLTLLNAGTGYIGVNFPTAATSGPGSTSFTITGSTTAIQNIYLGTGFRVVTQ